MGLECRTRNCRRQVVGQCRAGAHGIDAAAGQRPVHARADIPYRKHPAVAGGALVHVHGDEALIIQCQAALGQPAGRLCTSGKYGHVTGQVGSTAQVHRTRPHAHGHILQYGDVALLELVQHALLHGDGIVGCREFGATEQRHGGIGQAVAHGQREFNGTGTAANHRHAQCPFIAHRRNAGPQGTKGLNGAHKQRVLACTGDGALQYFAVLRGACVDGQPVKAQCAAILQKHGLLLRIDACCALLHPADACALHQWLQWNDAVL